jgi:hypothetical protein
VDFRYLHLPVTLDVAVQPLLNLLPSQCIVVVIAVGLAIGWAIFVALKPVAGLQLYVFPTTDVVPIVPLVVVQFKFKVEPASAVGGISVFTLTVTVEVAVHPLLPVTVTV